VKNFFSGFKVGIFIIVIALASWFTFHAVTEGLGGQKGYRVYALFNDATGLVDKSMVQIAGLRVGQITSRSLFKNKAKVVVFIGDDVKLYSNAMIAKKMRSMMGGYYLEIDPGTPESIDPVTGKLVQNRVLKNGDRILIVSESTTTEDIFNKTGKLLPEIHKLVVEVRKLTTGNVKKLIKNTDNAIVTNSKALNTLLKRIDSVTKDIKIITAVAPLQVGQIIKNIKDTTRDLKKIVRKTGGRIDTAGDSVQDSLSKISKLIDKLDDSLTGSKNIVGNTKDITENIKDITDKIKKGEGTIGKFVNSSKIADDIEQITTDTKTFIGGLARLETVVGLRSEYNLIANTVKTYISVQINPRQDKFYLIELIDDPRGLRSTSYTVTRTDNPNEPALSRVEEINVTDSFRFSFMFGKKIGALTFRFGIKESTGGAGLDISLLDNKFKIHMDVFDFSANVFPRLKIGFMWEFYRRMFLIAGSDDIMNERPKTGAGGGRDFFVGLQIRFTDEDLKSLLLVGGSAIGGAMK
jgi:phospholipid/cholesterol/gamma-HCH transport system substrate-binding protein